MQTTTTTYLAATLLALLPLAASAQNAGPPGGDKKLYCWDENGVQVCGDTVPASALDRARTEINARSGLRTGAVPRALEPDERAAAAAAARKAAEDAEAEAARERRDLAMVESYATEDDLRRAYGERIILVEESLKTSQLGMTNLRQSLLNLLRQAAELELHGKPVAKGLADSIQAQHADLLRQQATREKQIVDRASLGSDLEDALGRYRAMKGG